MKRIAILICAVLLSPVVHSADVPDAVRDAVSGLVSGAEPAWIEPAPIGGLWEVAIGPYVVYVSADGRHLMRGDILEVSTRDNLTEPARKRARRDAIDTIADGDMIVFSPDRVRHSVTVFTDVDCPYCAKLHREIDEYLARGIRVRYLAFPRAGPGSPTAQTMVSVWCADDRHKAMTDAKAGRTVPARTCANPVADEFELGRLLGVRGTPTIVLETGEVVPGYVPPDRLLQAIEQAKDEAAQREDEKAPS